MEGHTFKNIRVAQMTLTGSGKNVKLNGKGKGVGSSELKREDEQNQNRLYKELLKTNHKIPGTKTVRNQHVYADRYRKIR